MSFQERCAAVLGAKAQMDSSKVVCIEDALRLYVAGAIEYAERRLENAAQYCWGANRPEGW